MPGSAPRLAFLTRGWRNISAAGPRQLTVTVALLILALLVARYSWNVPVVSDAERSLYDLRAYLAAPRVEQDPRVQVIVYDDQTLIDARKRSPLDRGLLARALRNLDAMGAKSIGIDMVFDQPQDEDDQLVATLRAMKTPTFVGFANVKTMEENIVFKQQEYLDQFMGRLKGGGSKPASILIDNANGVTRNWPPPVEGMPETLVRAMTGVGDPDKAARFAGYDGALRYRLPKTDDQPVFSSLRIDLFADPEMAAALADQVRGRYVLIGGDIVDFDQVNTPFTALPVHPVAGAQGRSIPGILVHAAMIAQVLDGYLPRHLSGFELGLLGILVVLAATVTSLLEIRLLTLVPFLLLQLLLFGGFPFVMELRGMDSEHVPAVGWVVGWVVAFTAVGSAARASSAVQRKFAQGALGKYLPRDIAQRIIDNPELLELHGTKQQLYILFSDLEGFTQMSSELEPEVVAQLLNAYLDKLSKVVLDHGGVIDKYVGDAVVAFWGAPIARDNDAEMAAKAGYALWLAGEEFRRSQPDGLPPIGRTRVGLHYGEAVVGNFGGEGRIQYTALGDAMNTASRLESANKALGSSVMASREFAERSGLDWWRPMGRVKLRGRGRPVDLFEPAPGFPAEDRERLGEAVELIAADRDRAIALIQEIARRYPEDSALRNLLDRCSQLKEDNVYVLG